jgi:hypothetical protein
MNGRLHPVLSRSFHGLACCGLAGIFLALHAEWDRLLVILGGLAVEKMKQQEIKTAARQILGYLESHGDAPVIGMKVDLRNPEIQFYMGLGDLILQRRVTLQERQGSFWATQCQRSGRNA